LQSKQADEEFHSKNGISTVVKQARSKKFLKLKLPENLQEIDVTAYILLLLCSCGDPGADLSQVHKHSLEYARKNLTEPSPAAIELHV
jgi:hypothetical protein